MRPLPVFEPDPLELAWAAGFFDGEGSIGTYPQSRVRKDGTRALHTRMSVTQKDVRPLLRFQGALGGMGSIRRRAEQWREAEGRTLHDWQLVNREGIHLTIMLLWPYLSEPKREQITRACEARRVVAA